MDIQELLHEYFVVRERWQNHVDELNKMFKKTSNWAYYRASDISLKDKVIHIREENGSTVGGYPNTDINPLDFSACSIAQIAYEDVSDFKASFMELHENNVLFAHELHRKCLDTLFWECTWKAICQSLTNYLRYNGLKVRYAHQGVDYLFGVNKNGLLYVEEVKPERAERTFEVTEEKPKRKRWFTVDED